MRLSVAHTRLSMNKQTQDLSSVVIQLFPNFGSSQIQEKKRSNNGAPFLIQDGTKKYWLKLVNSSTMEDSLRDVEKQALQEVKSPNVIELIDVKTKVINGQRFDGLLFAFIEGEDLATIFAKKKSSKTPFTEDEVKKLLKDVILGIKAMSSKGWVHQDIKQKNIRFDKINNRYVILDLGIAYYSKDFHLTTGKHNKDYASSEQIYASVDKDKIPIISSKSDIAQLGQLTYELLTLKNPFKDDGQTKLNYQRIIEGKFVPVKKANSSISDELANIIDTMLNPHPGYRFRNPDDLLCALDGISYKQVFNFEKGVYMQIWKGPQGFKKNIQQVVREIQGVVISASQMPAQDSIDKAKEKGLKLIFDPETCLLTKDIDPSWQGGLSDWGWYSHPLKPSNFNSRNKISTFVSQVIQSQIDLGVDYITPPYFSVSNSQSEWRNLNGHFYHECLQFCKRISLDKPVICPIAVSQSLITVDKSRKELVDFYSQLPELNVFMLRVDAKDHNITVPVIQATAQLIEELEHHYPVLLTDAGTVAYGYFAKGLSACVTSLIDSKREHDLGAMQGNKKKGGNYKEKYFIPKMFHFVKVEGELPAMIRLLKTEALCECRVCKKAGFNSQSLKLNDADTFITKWSKIDRGNHFFSCIAEWREKMQSITDPKQKMNEYKKAIDEARAIYTKFKQNLIFSQMVKGEDCAVWDSAFFSK